MTITILYISKGKNNSKGKQIPHISNSQTQVFYVLLLKLSKVMKHFWLEGKDTLVFLKPKATFRRDSSKDTPTLISCHQVLC